MPWTFYLIYALIVIESICLCLKLNSLLIFCLKSYSELASENLIRCQEAVFLWKHFAKSQTAGNSNFAKSFLNEITFVIGSWRWSDEVLAKLVHGHQIDKFLVCCLKMRNCCALAQWFENCLMSKGWWELCVWFPFTSIVASLKGRH